MLKALGFAGLLFLGSGTLLHQAPGRAATINQSIDRTPQLSDGACCKVCHKGKACGDSCIAREKTCHQPPGCACDG
jgi:hypothetical protein